MPIPEDLLGIQVHSYISATHMQQALQPRLEGMVVPVEPAAMAVLVPEQSEALEALEQSEALAAHHISEVWSAMSLPD